MRIDYRPYFFDPCNTKLKSRFTKLIETIKNMNCSGGDDSCECECICPEIDMDAIKDAVSEAIDDANIENTMKKVIKDADIEGTMKKVIEETPIAIDDKEFHKIHSHIIRAENEIIETLSGGSACGGCCGNDCECDNHHVCSSPLTKEDLSDAIKEINNHTDMALQPISEAIDEINVSDISELTEKVDDVSNNVSELTEKVDDVSTNVSELKDEFEAFTNVYDVDKKVIKDSLKEVKDNVETLSNDFSDFVETYKTDKKYFDNRLNDIDNKIVNEFGESFVDDIDGMTLDYDTNVLTLNYTKGKEKKNINVDLTKLEDDIDIEDLSEG